MYCLVVAAASPYYPSQLLFGLPVVYDTDDASISAGDSILMTYGGKDIAVLDVTETYVPNKPKEVLECYRTSSLEHPGVQMVAMERGKYYVGGSIRGLNLPDRVFPCKTPAEVRDVEKERERATSLRQKQFDARRRRMKWKKRVAAEAKSKKAKNKGAAGKKNFRCDDAPPQRVSVLRQVNQKLLAKMQRGY